MEEPIKPAISFEEFQLLDIRVGTIIAADDFPKARKPAYKLHIDFGHLGVKRSSAQITVLYSIEELVGKQVMAVVNFAPRQVADFISEVLVLGVLGDNGQVILLRPSKLVEHGCPVS
jgi:tRNA-binding protein